MTTEIRARSRKLIEIALGTFAQQISSEMNLFEIASRIESEVFTVYPYPEYPFEYKGRIRTLFYNLKHNEKLATEIFSEKMSPRALILMEPKDMETEEQRAADNLWYLESLRMENQPDRENIEPLPSPAERKNMADFEEPGTGAE